MSVSDFRDWLGAIATAVAALFAAWAIWQSSRQAKASSIASLTERRVDHELSVLRALTEALTTPGRGSVAGLLSMLDARMPVTRGVFRVDATAEELTEAKELVRERVEREEPDLDLDATGRDLSWADSVFEPRRLALAFEEIAATAKALVTQRPSITGVSRGRK